MTYKYTYMMALSLASLMLLGGCNTLERDVKRAGNGVRAHYDATRHRIANYIYSKEEPPQEAPIVPPSSFCYQLMMDIVCYDRPRPDMHLKLVAVQGEHAYRYEDFLPEGAIAAGATSQSSGNGGGYGYNNGYVVSENAVTYRGSSGASGINVSDLGAIDGTTETPFYHSPSPAAGDSFGKTTEPMTVIEGVAERTQLAPTKLMQ